eukprot:TRINITY_DN19293_c0_g1_i1.p3 TRINITY_DN19293_c0_g1~~TRINITY_DN19293_c0_g1_i1.p3  ORF type:complete len:127 (+),score=14.45 TRINITY_DN19293_c0_g1_i1:244-624(+)
MSDTQIGFSFQPSEKIQDRLQNNLQAKLRIYNYFYKDNNQSYCLEYYLATSQRYPYKKVHNNYLKYEKTLLDTQLTQFPDSFYGNLKSSCDTVSDNQVLITNSYNGIYSQQKDYQIFKNMMNLEVK